MGEVVGVLLWRLGESLRHPFIKHSVPPNQTGEKNKTNPSWKKKKSKKHTHTKKKQTTKTLGKNKQTKNLKTI